MDQPTLLGDGCVTNQTGNQFSLWRGFNEHHQQAIVDSANHDQLIIENTGDAKRFNTAENFQKWLKTEPIIYVLTPKDKPNELSGLIWFVKLDLPEKVAKKLDQPADWTFAIRLYQQARGQRLSVPFMKEVLQRFWQQQPNRAVWLSTQAGNVIAQKIYGQAGWYFLGDHQQRAYYFIKP
jgi:hypothetical protein